MTRGRIYADTDGGNAGASAGLVELGTMGQAKLLSEQGATHRVRR